MALRKTLGSGAALALAAATLLGAAPTPPPSGSVLTSPDYKLETDQADYNQNTGDFTMPHKVRFSRPGTDAVADRATGNDKRGTATLYGHVTVHDNGSAPEVKGSGASEYNGPATLDCDELQIESRAGVYTAIGNVRFSQGDSNGSASRGVLDRSRHTLHLEGNVHLNSAGSSMTADNVDYNLQTKDVHTTGAPVIIRQPVPQETPPPPGTTPTPKPGRKRGK